MEVIIKENAETGCMLGARIIAACDAYDAMITDRPYRAGMSHADAVAELRRCSGTQFDPQVVDALIAELDARQVTDTSSICAQVSPLAQSPA